MNIVDFDPAKGQAFQGDIAIIRMPDTIAIARTDELKPIAGRLIIQEGEVSGHHHAINVMERPQHAPAATRRAKPSRTAERLLADALAGKIDVPTARIFRDPAAIEALRRADVLTRTDLAIGCLVLEHGPMVVTHEEHGGIRLPAGNYYLGRQVESAGAEERVVAD
jgi:hypothetical protein